MLGLIGVIIGASLAAGTQLILVHIRVRHEVLVAARLVRLSLDEVNDALRTLSVVFDETSVDELEAATRSWREHRVSLAHRLDVDELLSIAAVFSSTTRVRKMSVAAESDDEKSDALEEADVIRSSVPYAIELVDPLARPTALRRRYSRARAPGRESVD